MIRYALLALALTPAAVAANEADDLAKAIRKAKPAATCAVGPDCSAKWARALVWVKANSPLLLARDDEAVISTHMPSYPSMQSAIAVTLTGEGDRRTINLRVWCGNVLRCNPSSKDARRLFVQAVEDAKAV